MDKHFMAIAGFGVIILGLSGLAIGAVLTYFVPGNGAGTVCIALASTALGALAGVFIAPKVQTGNDLKNTQAPAD